MSSALDKNAKIEGDQVSRCGGFCHPLLKLSWGQKRGLQVAVDVVLIWVALWLGLFVRFDTAFPIDPLGRHAWLFISVPLFTIPIFVVAGMYRAVVRYFGVRALLTVFKSVFLSAAILALVILWRGQSPAWVVPRSLPILYGAFALLMIGGVRVLMRVLLSQTVSTRVEANHVSELPRVAIYGAGSAGQQLLTSLRIGREMQPVAFLDDDGDLVGRAVDGIPVFSGKQIGEMIKRSGVKEVLLALPSVSRNRRREILNELGKFPLHVRTVPGFMDLASGRVKVNDFQEVDICDLLGREPVAPDTALFEHCIREQVVLVTGAGGSIGSELCRQVMTSAPRILILFEHSEYSLYAIHGELENLIRERSLDTRLIPILGSVGNFGRLLDVMQTWQVNTVYHAAAYKHVPMVEYNVAEGFFNNTMGTLHTAQAAMVAGVQNFVLVSTDKAVRPTNIMGCTKRMAELVLQALAREPQPALFRDYGQVRVRNQTRFTMVRFGNVLGSSGSVIPVFREQLKNGGPLTVTHPEITRYFMTIPEAAQLVIQAGSMGEGGDVFVLDMGEPVKIVELAEKKIRLSGFTVRNAENPNGDIEIVFTGLRPGEKLYEELLIGDDVLPTQHQMIMRAQEAYISWDELKQKLQSTIDAIKSDDYTVVRARIQELVIGYRPDARICDLIYAERQALPKVA